MRAAKTKALISFAVTAKLICAFVFAYADCWSSHAAAHLICNEIRHQIGLFYDVYWQMFEQLYSTLYVLRVRCLKALLPQGLLL